MNRIARRKADKEIKRRAKKQERMKRKIKEELDKDVKFQQESVAFVKDNFKALSGLYGYGFTKDIEKDIPKRGRPKKQPQISQQEAKKEKPYNEETKKALFILDTVARIKGVKRAELARRIGINTSRVSQLFHQNNPSTNFETIAKMCKALGVKLELNIEGVSSLDEIPKEETEIQSKRKKG